MQSFANSWRYLLPDCHSLPANREVLRLTENGVPSDQVFQTHLPVLSRVVTSMQCSKMTKAILSKTLLSKKLNDPIFWSEALIQRHKDNDR
jgi:hypothetical protein